jgi:hypothetical protein
MVNKPVIVFDTSALNSLAYDSDSAALIPGLTSGFTVCLTGTSVDEIAAWRCGIDQRKMLLNLCKRLLSSGLCMLSHDALLRTLTTHFSETKKLNWRSVSARFADYEQEIARQENMTDELAEKQKNYMRRRQKEFAKLFDDDRPAFDRLYSRETPTRPRTFPEFVSRLGIEGGAFWGIGASFCEQVTGYRPDEQAIRKFIDKCPPFRAWLLAICFAQYDRCIRDPNSGPSLRAGKFDLYMSVYLPYCDQFITAEKRGRQLRALQEVASAANLGVRVRSYGDFKNGLLGIPAVVVSRQ